MYYSLDLHVLLSYIFMDDFLQIPLMNLEVSVLGTKRVLAYVMVLFRQHVLLLIRR